MDGTKRGKEERKKQERGEERIRGERRKKIE